MRYDDMAKQLKRFLLVILALSILMVNATGALAEEQDKANLFLVAPGRIDETIGMAIQGAGVDFSLVNGSISYEQYTNFWIILAFLDHALPQAIPDAPVPEGIVFVDAIITPKADHEDEDVNQIVEDLIQRAQAGTTVYLFTQKYDASAANMDVPQLLNKVIEKIDKLAGDPESVITKSEENVYAVSNAAKDTESVGYIRTYTIAENSPTRFATPCANLIAEIIANHNK